MKLFEITHDLKAEVNAFIKHFQNSHHAKEALVLKDGALKLIQKIKL